MLLATRPLLPFFPAIIIPPMSDLENAAVMADESSAAAQCEGGYFGIPADKLTPLFRQYLAIKREHPAAILLYRLGDFYEMFGPDAQRACGILGVMLTAREAAKGMKVPMCGVPHHALMRYVKKLVDAGEMVAVCDQMEDPAQAKGIVRRAVTRVITAGTLVEDEFLSEDSGVFLLTLCEHKGRLGFLLLEASGGRVGFTELDAKRGRERMLAEIERVRPQELLIDETLAASAEMAAFQRAHPLAVVHTFAKGVSVQDAEFFAKKFLGSEHLDGFGLKGAGAALIGLFHLVRYLREVFKVGQPKLFVQPLALDAKLMLDERAVRHLELFALQENGAARELAGGMFGILNCARTAMGKRLLKERLAAPFAEPAVINNYLDAVEELAQGEDAARVLGDALARVADVERIVNRVCLDRTNPRELAKLRESLTKLPDIKRALEASSAALLQRLGESLPECADAREKLDALADDPPSSGAAGAFREGFNGELDRLRNIAANGAAWFAQYEQRQRDATGIRSLRVKHTGAFGWFIEITKSNLHLVHDGMGLKRRQTLVGAERFTTEELSEHERELVSAQDDALRLEQRLLAELLDFLRSRADELHAAAMALAEADYILTLAEVARREEWARPLVDSSRVLEIKDGVHPLVQRAVSKQRFVANDAYMDNETVQVCLITGPNMGGKSTYMRMAALVVILSQMGSFVPARSAHIGVVDRIFTRIGTADALVLGKSTFMVEMVETAEILHAATERSLVILDEIGRGTSTYDGISIARAVAEYLHSGKRAHPKTLFATHYFELTDLAELFPRIRNLKVEVRMTGGELVFLYKVVPGFVDESYGVEVAKLAGLPPEVVTRAREVLAELEEVKRESLLKSRRILQMGLFVKE